MLNKQKFEMLIEKSPMLCKCWPTDQNETCHWRLFGNNMALDKTSSINIKNWKCEARISTQIVEPEPEKNFRIPGIFFEKNILEKSEKKMTKKTLELRCPASPGRIVNGVEAKRGAWPWMVRMMFGPFTCGGTLVKPNLLITAAHCCRKGVT